MTNPVRTSLLSALALAAALPCAAQDLAPSDLAGPPADATPWTWSGLVPAPFPPEASADPRGLLFVEPATPSRLRPRPAATGLDERLFLAAGPAAAAAAGLRWGASGAAPLLRSNLEGGPVGFEELPGGIVFGMEARPDAPLPAPRLGEGDGRLAVTSRGATFLLPAEDPAVLATCARIAVDEPEDQALVDIRGSGEVRLAPVILDTSVGRTLVECDRIPHLHVPGMSDAKSLVLDREVVLRVDRERGLLVPEADLEVRFYRQPEPGALGGEAACIVRLPAIGTLGASLAEGARIAGWVGFFRWAQRVDPEGLQRVRASLERAEAPPVASPTPRWIDHGPPGARTPSPVEPSRVEDWMRAHRAQRSHREAHTAGGRPPSPPR